MLSKRLEAFQNKLRESDIDVSLITDEEKKLIKPLGLLTEKPIIYATNLGEDELARGNSFSEEVNTLATKEGSECVKISAQVEAELIELGEEERDDYLNGLGVEEGAHTGEWRRSCQRRRTAG